MDIFKKFATDAAKEVNGVRHPLDATTVIVVARFGNDNANALFRTLRERHAIVLASTDPKIADKAAVDNLIEVMANHILVGWEGIEFNGAPLEYSVSNAVTLLQLTDFRDLVFNLSRNADNYRYDAIEKQEKNSSAA
jgi:hypothetical protein